MANKEKFEPNAFGWRTLLGNVDFTSTPVPTAEYETMARGAGVQDAGQEFFARFSAPMAGVSKSIKTGIEPGKKYEAGFNVASDSATGFFTATVTFLNEKGIPLGIPCSTGVKLGDMQPDQYAPVSFVAGPAPKGAVQADLALIAVGAAPDKVIDINQVYFKEIGEVES